MEFGVPSPHLNLAALDHTLPPGRDPVFFQGQTQHCFPRIRTAAPVWIAPEWKGDIYPPKTKPSDFLFHYSRFFQSIELNMTFYRAPTPAMVNRWAETTPDGFLFCPKIIQSLSRAKGLDVTKDSIRTFCDSLRDLGPKLGPFFLQLPPHHSRDQFGALERFLDAFPDDLRLAIEFRNASYFAGRQLLPEVARSLADRQRIPLITDTLGRRDVLHTTLTAPWTMIRFLGNELHETDFLRLDAWLARFHQWKEAGIKEVFLFLHHPTFVHVPALARYVAENFDVPKALC